MIQTCTFHECMYSQVRPSSTFQRTCLQSVFTLNVLAMTWQIGHIIVYHQVWLLNPSTYLHPSLVWVLTLGKIGSAVSEHSANLMGSSFLEVCTYHPVAMVPCSLPLSSSTYSLHHIDVDDLLHRGSSRDVLPRRRCTLCNLFPIHHDENIWLKTDNFFREKNVHRVF